MELWIGFTLVAVVMQSVRTAGQKQIAGSISIQATTLVRFLFGLPFAVAYFLFLKSTYQLEVIDPDWAFFRSASLAAVSQIFATVFLVKALMVRNFAVGTALAKTEAILTAIIGAWFFSATLSFVAYLAVAVGVLGVLVASNWKITLQDLADNKSIKYGIGAGLGFALASLWIRDASLGLELPRLLSAATVLVYMVALQTVICLLWIAIKEKHQFRLIAQNLLPAMSLQNAAIVKTLGQTEFVLTLLITYLYFGERITGREYAGMALVGASVLLLLTTSV